MLANTLYRVPSEKGLKVLQRRGDGEASEITSWRLHLEAGGRERYLNADEETVLVLQQGAGSLSAAGHFSPVWATSSRLRIIAAT